MIKMTILIFVTLLTPFIAIAQDEWITEEVLKQLTEIRQEVKSLRKEMSLLRSEIASTDIKNKAPKITSVALGDAPRLGSKDSKIAIIEFSDYQCPYCVRHFKQTLPLLKSNYIDTGKIQYIMNDFPLSFHPKAKLASIATHCAAQQNEEAYWQMHTSLFSGSGLNKDNYIALSKEASLDEAKFINCLDSSELSRQIDDSLAYGQKIGVSGTPAFFIGKVEGDQLVDVKRLVGAQPYSSFSRAIDSLLNKQSVASN